MTPELEALERLAPCPFCGQQPRISKRQDEDLLWSHNSVEWTFVSCSDCDVSFSSPPNSETDAVSKWNTRPSPTPRPWLRAEEVREPGWYLCGRICSDWKEYLQVRADYGVVEVQTYRDTEWGLMSEFADNLDRFQGPLKPEPPKE